jgi:hypothetical protein
MSAKPTRPRGWLARHQQAPPPVGAPADTAAAERAGVDLVAPAGERFDPGRHEAAGTQPTRDPALVGTVATVEVPGYADRGVLVRAPVVTVYRAGAPG